MLGFLNGAPGVYHTEGWYAITKGNLPNETGHAGKGGIQGATVRQV